jgi:cyclic beta-1,2-glucan synthetase
VPHDESDTMANSQRKFFRIVSLASRNSGKKIRRSIERRFDAILHDIANDDPAKIRQTTSARWILDNSHLVRQALQQIEIDLPKEFHRQLPTQSVDQGGRTPRVFALVDQCIDDSGLPIDCEFLESKCRDFQSTSSSLTQLTIGELWAIPIALRITLIRRLCDAAELSQNQTERTTEFVDSDIDVAVVAGCIIGLRTVATYNWPAFVENASALEACLRQDPAGFYRRMDFPTRDRYRGAVERIARGAHAEQWEVAQTALDLAQRAHGTKDAVHRHHVGYYLVDKGRPQLENAVKYRRSTAARCVVCLKNHLAGFYLSSIVILAIAAAITLFIALMTDDAHVAVAVTAALIALVPLLSVGSGAVNFLVSILVAPASLPKLDFSTRIPANQQAIVVVPMLLSAAQDIAENLRTLEHNYLGNADTRLRFALLSDFTDAPTATTSQDEALLNQAIAGIDGLNQRYGAKNQHPFGLFHRRRQWNDTAKCWMGWERKRGKLEEFNELLRGNTDTSYVLQHGEGLSDFDQIRYVITLDADSYMPTGAAARLVGTLAHPLNRPRFDDTGEKIVGGYTVIQPRLETNPVTGADTLFAKVFAGDVMLDLYTNAVSDVYQDLFGDAVFAGKGIYDVDAFRQSLNARIPDNTILSHDLLEGLHGRAGLASDIVLLENYPSNYPVYLKRLHRWVRGDWQLLPWLLPRKNVATDAFDPGLIGYWKLFDNLRRSLVTPAILLLLIIAWLTLPDNLAAWTVVFALFPGLPILLRITLALRTSLWRWGTIESSFRNLVEHAGSDALRWTLALVFLPSEAYIVTDAVLRTLYRVLISRQRLLEWTSAAQVSRTMSTGISASGYYRNLWFGPATAIATSLAIFIFNPHSLLAASVLLVLWICSPLIALALGRRIEEQPPLRLSETDALFIRGIARDTWRFFERFVGPDTCWLPPDNVQEFPARKIAERTSPTNIGMLLLSTITAFDLGYLGQRQLLTRLRSHLETIQRMRKHRGHLYNWYSTRDLVPLEPLYISTVDSGNFVAALIILRQTLTELPATPRVVERVIVGLTDELAALRRKLFPDESQPQDASNLALLDVLNSAQEVLSDAHDPLAVAHQFEDRYCGEIEHAFLAAFEQNPTRWSAEEIANFRENSRVFRQRLRIILADVELFSPWLARLLATPTVLVREPYQHQFAELARHLNIVNHEDKSSQWFETAHRLITKMMDAVASSMHLERDADANAWLDSLQSELTKTQVAAQMLNESRLELIDLIGVLIKKTDFRFLYDGNRNLFRVGYNASTGEADSSYYDLLASEARIASLIAIAKGDVPPKHWMHLGRPLTRVRGLRILLSWSATAFEYLMPRLIMHSPPSGLLNQSCAGVVMEQIRFGHEHGIPWGVSESGYAQFDPQGNYQYFAFGIPKLGLKWDQGERLVVSSYSSLLALPYAPQETVRNLHRLISLGGAGHYGLFEALDFGDARTPRAARPRVVQSYMSHHQGMMLVAIGNALHEDETPRRFHRDPRIASVEHLLYERLPSRLQTRPLERLPALLKELTAAPATVEQWRVEPDTRELAMLSNGRLSSRISGQGSSALYWRGTAVTRWDPLADGPTGGTCVFLKDLDSDEVRCLGADILPPDVETFFAPHSAEFRAHRQDMLMRMTVSVAPAEDVEIRKITITNDGPRRKRIMLASYCEPVLGAEDGDRRHPAFSKMFVESQLLSDDGVLLFRRRPRETNQSSVYLAHGAVTQASYEEKREFEVDRGAFLGRSADRGNPAALVDPAYVFNATANANLDPCAAIVLTLEIPPRATVQCAFLSSVADSRSGALNALKPFQSFDRIDWALEAARMQSERELSAMRTDSVIVRAAFRLLPALVWPYTLAHIGDDAFNNIHRVQDTLWRHGISGDRPIITFRIDGEEDLGPAADLLKSISYLSRKGFAIDAVFLDETKGGYVLPINDRLRELIEGHLAPGREHNGSLAFIVPVRNLAVGEKAALVAAARIYVDAGDRKFGGRLGVAEPDPARMPAFVPQPSSPLTEDAVDPIRGRDDLLLETTLGGLLPDLGGYSMLISNESRTPAPWCNVLANPSFGTLISESGSMCTWWGNSSENRLTPWSNDPVLDKTGEALYVRDEETGESWSLTPQPRPDGFPYRVTHAIGETLFEHNSHGLGQRLQVFVDAEQPIKFLRIRLDNKLSRARRLTVTFAVDWLLGNSHSNSRHLLLPERDEATGALLIRNGFIRNAGDEVAFLACNLSAHGVTCDGQEFFGRRHAWTAPAGLAAVGLSDYVAPSARPCAVYQVHIDLQANENREFHFVLGAAPDPSSARALITQSFDPSWIDDRYDVMREQWDGLLNTWHVTTPDLATDAMLNRWLLYQVISSRLWGRIGFYQASGGFGFRDQLQDVLALLDTHPAAAREQILTAASRQFEQGDVLHWWHETPLRGVRTRCSDDLLWLAYAVAEYVEVTDDASILHDTEPFLHGEPLGEHELERYAEYQTSQRQASVYEHCCRAIDARMAFGAHGMPFIGTGDWNDGLNRVGVKGQGESVWMAWFLVIVCRRFAPLCRLMQDQDRADHYTTMAEDLLRRTQTSAWTGDWYLRGYFDDGTPLGAPGDAESAIDLNAQTWAVLADAEHPDAHRAMQSVEEKLIDKDHQLIKLLTPPFQKTAHDPGYIRAYPPGVRENGGQYTHAAVWTPWAAVQLGDKYNALRWFDWLNPLKRARTDDEIDHYRLEPYVTPGDIYGIDSLAGRGGWSWYTGSAAWLYRLGIRQLLGLQRRGDQIFIRPCLPASWPLFHATLKHKDAEHRFVIHAPTDIHGDKLFIIKNGLCMDVSSIELQADGIHDYEVFASELARKNWLSAQPA